MMPPLANPDDVISVAALNRLARELLELGVPRVWISGEVSNWMVAASGHAYFSLKDAQAQVRCVLFRHQLAKSPIKPHNGMQIELKGQVSLYEARGEFQINVDTLRSAGLGQLFEAFERLKAKLQAEGLFDPQRKRELPRHPRAIGIVTSPAAAALRDVVTTLRRRMPGIPLILYPTPVQGDGAAAQIAAAITSAGRRAETDVLIVCRGGGSIEDLWAFNEEIVARAIADCPIPVVSGVGHETDFTISDFVADQRAPTPTGAAELVSPNREELLQRVSQAHHRLQRIMDRLLSERIQRLDYLSRRLVSPQQRLSRQRETLQMAQLRLQHGIRRVVDLRRQQLNLAENHLSRLTPDANAARRRLDQLAMRLQQGIQFVTDSRRQRLAQLQATLDALNPEAVLARGYAIVQTTNGKALKSPNEVKRGERVTLRLAEGATEAVIDPPMQQTQLPF